MDKDGIEVTLEEGASIQKIDGDIEEDKVVGTLKNRKDYRREGHYDGFVKKSSAASKKAPHWRQQP